MERILTASLLLIILGTINALRDGSAIPWQRVNRHGECDFSEEKQQNSLGLGLTKSEGSKGGKKREGEIRAK